MICKVGCYAKRGAANRARKAMEERTGKDLVLKPCDIAGCGGLHIVERSVTAKPEKRN